MTVAGSCAELAALAPGLTAAELHAMDLTAELMNLISQEVIGDGPTRNQDINEAALRIHAIQQMIMSQAAARAHPDRFRLLGEVMP